MVPVLTMPAPLVIVVLPAPLLTMRPELAMAAAVLWFGAAGGTHVALLAAGLLAAAPVAWIYHRRRQRWSGARLAMTHDLVERLAGHRTRLAQEAPRLDALAQAAGWRLVGGTALFRTYAVPNAAQAQERLARRRIWSRIFPYSPHWLRLGLPGNPQEWGRLAAALA